MNETEWLAEFASALKRSDIEGVTSLFAEECYWRDLLAFTWNIKTLESRSAIADMLKARLADVQPGSFKAGERNGWFTFETALATFTRQFELTIEKKLFDRKLASKNNATMIIDSQGWLDYSLDHVAIQDATGMRIDGVMSDTRQSMNTSFGIARTNATLPAKVAKGFAYTESAAFFVARLPDEPTFEGDPVGLNEVVHPDCELPMLFRVWKDPKTAILQMDAATIFDFYPNQAEAVERFVAP